MWVCEEVERCRREGVSLRQVCGVGGMTVSFQNTISQTTGRKESEGAGERETSGIAIASREREVRVEICVCA